MTIKLSNPTGRNTNARILETLDCDLFFSYETCIAFRHWRGPDLIALRRPNSWGPTTGRHFRELGCADFRCTETGEDFEKALNELISSGAAD